MRDWYDFNRDVIKSIIENPIDAIVSALFIGGVFG